MAAAKKQVPQEPLSFVLRGHRAPLREKRNEFLRYTQKSTHGQHPNSHESVKSQASLGNLENTSWIQEEEMAGLSPRKDSPTIEDLEESLQKLKVHVCPRLVPSSSQDSDTDDGSGSEATDLWRSTQAQWPEVHRGPSPTKEGEALAQAPVPLARPVGNDLSLRTLGLPVRSLAPGRYRAGLLGNEVAPTSCLPSVTLLMDGPPAQAFPPKLGAPHVIGVKSLLPPKIPVRSCSPGIPRGRSLSLTRSHSFSPASKRTRWVRSRSQSPRPIWRPTSAKANACAQPPPQLIRPGGSRKKMTPSRPSRSRTCKTGHWATRRACMTPEPREEDALDHSWSPYCLPVPGISSPLAQEMNERFFQTLTESNVHQSLGTMDPIQKTLTRLRLQRLRAEEEWVLELKRQQELERTRGPRSKWYEMKSSQFHYEAHKHNEWLRNSQDSPFLYNYRQELASRAEEFEERSKPPHLDSFLTRQDH
ncbi:uncharacterized protein LOC127556010 isoform X1 [Antechinus flavipes]|uniref:uncharacterized protein LOC127556010 isoform X1 n=2 Tax=Antechinus flavipes TaxID=38775 RepID=UPI0022362F6D|nr:uncharacterized protein LOC127556010 isoform X1 [Antechinus flavipes]